MSWSVLVVEMVNSLSKLNIVAICNIFSKKCLCQNWRHVSTCQGNVAHKTAFLPPFHDLYGSEAHSQRCAIVGRPRAVWPLHGGVTFVLPGAWRTSGVAFANSRPAPCANSLCGTTKAPCGLNMYSAATSVRWIRLQKQATGPPHRHITHSPQSLFIPPKIHNTSSKNVQHSIFQKNSGQGKGSFQMISANIHSNFDRALTLSFLAQRPNFSEDLLNSL